MPTITVYQNEKVVTTETIKREYSIIETSAGGLFWFEEELGRPIPGVLKIWIQGRPEGPLLCYVLPDWQLIIDGIWMEKKFYEDIKDIEGKEVELRYKDHRFVFYF